MRGKYGLKAVALAAIATLGLSSLGLGGAFAAPGDPVDVSSITKDTGSLSIHKYTPTTSGSVEGKNNGAKLPDKTLEKLGANPIEGVKFNIRQITNLDIKTNEGWKKAEELSATFNSTPVEKTITDFTCEDPSTKCTLGTASQVITGANGSVKKEGLPVGFYFVEEITSPAYKVTIHKDASEVEEVSSNSLVKAKPFIISIPLTEPTKRDSWMYDVHVYPKNSTISNEKKVEDAKTPGAGNADGKSRIQYTIETGIPVGVDKLDKYMIVDPLDARLTPATASTDYVSPLKELSLIDASGAVISDSKYTLTRDTDYQLITKAVEPAPTSTNASPQTGNYLTIKFLKTGLEKLVNARDDSNANAVKIRWTLLADIKSVSKDEDGSNIKNKSYVIPPNSPDDEWDPNNPEGTPPNPSNETVSKYGKVTIQKTGSNNVGKDHATKLNGAKFKLYMCDKDGNFTNFNGEVLKKDISTKKYSDADLRDYAVKVNGKSEWITGTDGEKAEDGKIVINGLQLNDFKNGSANEEEGTQPKTWAENHFYCLLETQAPDGYSLIPEPIKFQLLTTDTVPNKKDSFAKSLNVKNVPANGGFHIPITGGRGIALIAGAGGVLIIGSMIYTASAARGRHQEA